jgi:hypothetical protein
MALKGETAMSAIVGGGLGVAAGLVAGKSVSAHAVDPAQNIVIDLSDLQGIVAELKESINQLASAFSTQNQEGEQVVIGVIPNARRIKNVKVTLPAANTAYQLPDFEVIDGLDLKIKANVLNVGSIYIGPSAAEAKNPNQAEELSRGEFTLYRIKNAKELYISGTSAADSITLTTETR